MKTFISGKVSGEPYDQVKTKFFLAEYDLLKKGFKVVNPIWFVPQRTEQTEAMKLCIARLLKCDAIYMLRDWEQSEGANLE